MYGEIPSFANIFIELSDTDESGSNNASPTHRAGSASAPFPIATQRLSKMGLTKPVVEVEDEPDYAAEVIFTNVESGEKKELGEEDLELEMQDNILAPATLRAITRNPDLHLVSTIEIQVNTEGQSLDDIGVNLPNLVELKLDGSFITSLRDLGLSSLKHLQKLHVGMCGLTDLDGVEYLVMLQELYASNNQIDDVSTLLGHPGLQLLDLSRNSIKEPNAIEFLEGIPKLVSLRLMGNFICHLTYYRNIVCSRIPLLCVLDGKEVTDNDREMVTEEQEKLIDETAKREADERMSVQSSLHEYSWAALANPDRPGSPSKQGSWSCPNTSDGNRPGTASQWNRPTTPASPGTPLAMRPGSAARPRTAFGRPASAPEEDTKVSQEDLAAASDLSLGRGVLCGSFVKSRRRDKGKKKDKKERKKEKEEKKEKKKEKKEKKKEKVVIPSGLVMTCSSCSTVFNSVTGLGEHRRLCKGK